MTRLAFLSPHESELEAVSPLRHALSEAFVDCSLLGKLEVHVNADGLDGAIPRGPGRSLLVLEGDVRATRDRLAAEGYRVYDQTAALAGLEVEGEALMRRLTALDLEQLPAVGAVARNVPAVIQRLGDERFRLFVPQELGHYVAEVVTDMKQGLAL